VCFVCIGIAGEQFCSTSGPDCPGINRVMAAARHEGSLDKDKMQHLSDIFQHNREVMDALNARSIQPNYLIQGTYDLSNRYYEQAKSEDVVGSENAVRSFTIAEYLALRAQMLMDSFVISIQASIMYYLWLLLPFAYFLERLLFAYDDRKKQTAVRLAIFLGCVTILYFNHPAFYGNTEPLKLVVWLIVLDLVLTLLAPSISNAFNRFTRNVRERFKHERRHQVDVGRTTALVMAFLLGVANMRRRRVRTFLTCATLVILTFAVLAFVSFQSDLGFNIVPVGVIPSYAGVLVRDVDLKPLPAVLYDLGLDYIGDLGCIAPRAWVYSDRSTIGVQTPAKAYKLRAILGLSVNEVDITGVDRGLAAGRWFEEDESGVAIVSSTFASNSNLFLGDTITLVNQQFKVIGVFDEKGFEQITDLDGKALLPRTALTSTDELGYVTVLETQVSAADVVIVPYSDVLIMGGRLQSLALEANDRQSPMKMRDDLVLRMPYALYVGDGNSAKGYILTSLLSVKGMENLLMPMVIVGLIVLNTMLGSVYERHHEIGIYSSVGLSPLHIGGLFFAESVVYALLGAVSGYLAGLLATRIIVTFNLLPGLTLNYSSFGTLYTMGAVMLIVMLSSIYPSVMASRIAVPKIERRWRLPQMVGDTSELILPFVFSQNEALGGLVYLKSIFDGATDKTYQFGSMVDSSLRAVDMKYGEGYELEMKIHLAPYDLGINQMVWVRMIPQPGSQVFDIKVNLQKLTGDTPSWNRSNRPFLTEMRKQCLVWRTMSPQVKEDYTRKGQKLFTAQDLEVSVDDDVAELIEVKCPHCGERFAMSAQSIKR
jgi:cell division protein FtsX